MKKRYDNFWYSIAFLLWIFLAYGAMKGPVNNYIETYLEDNIMADGGSWGR